MPEVVIDLDYLKYLENIERKAQHLSGLTNDPQDEWETDETAIRFKIAFHNLLVSLKPRNTLTNFLAGEANEETLPDNAPTDQQDPFRAL